MAELCVIAKFCNFDDTLNLMIRNRLVCRINDEIASGLVKLSLQSGQNHQILHGVSVAPTEQF